MSEAIKIKEGGIDRSQNQIHKLKTNTVGGGVCFWVPETERQTDDKRITENGTYTAEEEGIYGYDEIVVSVPNTGSMGGKGADGNDYSITVDDNGYIVETKIPSAIRIETLPSRLQYTEGDAISYSGIVVGAYDAQGNRMQEVPFSELVFPINTAHASGSGGGSASSDYQGNLPQPINFHVGDTVVKRNYSEYDFYNLEYTFEVGTAHIVAQIDGDYERLFMASSAPFSGGVYDHFRRTGDEEEEETHRRIGDFYSSTRNIHGQDVYFTEIQIRQVSSIEDYGAPLYTARPNDNDMYTLAYGDITIGGTQRLPVQWNRPTDYKTLEDYFEISVEDS